MHVFYFDKFNNGLLGSNIYINNKKYIIGYQYLKIKMCFVKTNSKNFLKITIIVKKKACIVLVLFFRKCL